MGPVLAGSLTELTPRASAGGTEPVVAQESWSGDSPFDVLVKAPEQQDEVVAVLAAEEQTRQPTRALARSNEDGRALRGSEAFPSTESFVVADGSTIRSKTAHGSEFEIGPALPTGNAPNLGPGNANWGSPTQSRFSPSFQGTSASPPTAGVLSAPNDSLSRQGPTDLVPRRKEDFDKPPASTSDKAVAQNRKGGSLQDDSAPTQYAAYGHKLAEKTIARAPAIAGDSETANGIQQSFPSRPPLPEPVTVLSPKNTTPDNVPKPEMPRGQNLNLSRAVTVTGVPDVVGVSSSAMASQSEAGSAPEMHEPSLAERNSYVGSLDGIRPQSARYEHGRHPIEIAGFQVSSRPSPSPRERELAFDPGATMRPDRGTSSEGHGSAKSFEGREANRNFVDRTHSTPNAMREAPVFQDGRGSSTAIRQTSSQAKALETPLTVSKSNADASQYTPRLFPAAPAQPLDRMNTRVPIQSVGQDIDRLAIEGALDDPIRVETRSSDSVSRPEILPNNRTDQTKAVLSQLSNAVRRFPDAPIEVFLSPEELGKVRLSLSGTEGAMTVHVMAERPETLDLIRRHIDLLAADLRNQGFETLDFGFAGQGEADQDGMPERKLDEGAFAGTSNIQTEVVPPQPTHRALEAGLNLRL